MPWAHRVPCFAVVLAVTVAALFSSPWSASAATTVTDSNSKFLDRTRSTGANLRMVSPRVTLGSVTFTPESGSLQLGGAGASPRILRARVLVSVGRKIVPGAARAVITVDLTSRVKALGWDIPQVLRTNGCGAGASAGLCLDSTFEVTLKRGRAIVDTLTFAPASDTPTFVGVTSDTAFDRAEIRQVLARSARDKDLGGSSRSMLGNPSPDADGDGIPDVEDNCPFDVNPNQEDADADQFGNACDTDDDNDGVLDPSDADDDGDAIPDGSDNCKGVANTDQADRDGDGLGDACDSAPDFADYDGDGVATGADNCPYAANPGQEDADADGRGDPCDNQDDDGDGVPNAVDNCPLESNPDQDDDDQDGFGDICDDVAGMGCGGGAFTAAISTGVLLLVRRRRVAARDQDDRNRPGGA